jgi:spore coat-associated protein N
MRRKIRLTALVAISVLMLALLIGGLYGTFDDTETSIGNVFTAGTLNLVSVISGSGFTDNVMVNEQGDGINDNVTFGMVMPGDNGTITWTLTNDGTVDGSLTLVSTVVGSENGLNEPEIASGDTIGDGTGELDDLILCTLYLDGSDVSGGEITLAAMQAFLNDTVLLNAGQTVVYRLDWRIDNVSTGNELQSDTAQIDINFTLTQV